MSEVDLSSIRQAYRYVVAYQQRLRDALCELDLELAALDYTFNSWGPLHFARPPGATNAFFHNRWMWDLVPMYSFIVTWTFGGKWANEPGQTFIWIEHIVDTGFAVKNKEPDPLAFKSASESDTLLRARWLKLNKKVADSAWRNGASGVSQCHFKETAADLWPEHPSPKITKRSSRGVETGGLCVSLEKLATPEAFRESFSEVVVKQAERLAPWVEVQ